MAHKEIYKLLIGMRTDTLLNTAFAITKTFSINRDIDGYYYTHKMRGVTTSTHYKNEHEALVAFLLADEPANGEK